MDDSPPGSSVHAILQAGIWSHMPFPSLGDLPYPGTEPPCPVSQAYSLPLSTKACRNWMPVLQSHWNIQDMEKDRDFPSSWPHQLLGSTAEILSRSGLGPRNHHFMPSRCLMWTLDFENSQEWDSFSRFSCFCNSLPRKTEFLSFILIIYFWLC